MNIKEEYQTFKNGTRHLRQTCRDCGKFLGFKQQDLPDNFIMPFGKHKDKMFKDLDISYLKWLKDQDWVKDNMKAKATEIISDHFYKKIEKEREEQAKLHPNPCYKCGDQVSDLTLSLCCKCAHPNV